MANEGKTSGIEMQDTLFGAMYEIARGVIAQQEYDITKECKIIEVYLDSKGERTGIYKVKSQDATYDAYAQQGDIYSLDQQVYVQIPNGDYNNNKFIVGQKVDKNDASDVYNLKMPFDNFLGLYNLTLSTPMEEHGYWANNPTQGVSDDLVAEEDENGLYYPKNGDHVWHWQNVGNTAMYATQIGIEVDITTLLHGFSLVSGNYGFRVVVHGLGYDDEAKDTMKDLTREYYFDTSSMYGNSYAYTMGTTQQCVLDVKNFLRIDSIDLWFWQDHNFKDEAGSLIPYAGVNTEELAAQLKADIEVLKKDDTLTAAEKEKKEQELYLAFSAKISDSAERPNIIFNNLRVLLGLALDQLSEETVYVYTYDKLKYGADGTAESGEVKTADRTLNLAWVHKYNNTAELVDTYGALESFDAKVYWYYYDPEWVPEHVEYDYENPMHRFGGNYWHPYAVDESIVYDEYAPLEFIVTPDVQKNTSKYKAVIHYNNTYVTSNIITFANVEAVETNNANLARNDKIILRISQIRKVKDDGTTILETDDTLGNFFVYDENNAVLTNADNKKFSDVQYFIEPWIKVDLYDPENPAETDDKYGYERLVDYRDPDTNNLLNFSISWQFPDSMRYTMIKSWGILDDTFRNESYWNARSEEQFTRDVYTTRYFQISPLLDAQYGNNDIGAVIDIAGMGTFNIKKELIFGQACSFGCEYTPVITISTPTGNSYIDTNTEFEMYCLVYDRQGKLLDENLRSECEFDWKYIGTRYKPVDNRLHENYMGFIGNVIKGRITQPYPFVVEVTVKGAAAYDITVRRGIMVGNDSEFMQTHDIMCPNRVEFRSDGQAPIYQSNVFEVAVIKEDGTENELIYPEWKINQERVLTLKESISTYPDLISPIGGYFDKPNDNTCYALAFSAHTLNSNSANPNAYAQQWTDDLLTDEMFTYILFTYGTATVAQGIAFAQNLYPSSLVNEWDGQSLSLDEENSAIIAKMIAAGTKDQKNRFTGVMMGDWSEKGDSSLDVPGLYGFNAGAQSFGFKTDGTGFIGPAGEGRIQFDGRNALISNSSKTCYINLNPRRVTQFMDGNDKDGYTLDNQAWDSVGNQSYSQYFLYSKAPRRVNSFSYTEEDGIKIDNSADWVADWDQHTDLLWVKPFMEDADNDYFVVDPNYGVATTGGIFARYGRLGHEYPWIISDYGLTQKNIFGRIFLGNPEKNLSVGQNIPTPKFTNEINNEIDDSEIEVPANFFSASFANVKNIIQTGIRADGYLYTKYAAIGGWYVNDSEIYSVDSETYESDDSSKGFRKAYSDDGYKKDLLNINSKNQFISFNNGRFVINGKYGWMGFYSHQNEDKTYNTIELIKSPSAYNMWIDFENGAVNFGKEQPTEYDADGHLIDTIPHVVINGRDGNAYFAQGKIVIDGSNATIFCGIQTENVITKDIVTMGNLHLARVSLTGTSLGKTSYNLTRLNSNTFNSTVETNRTTGEVQGVDLKRFSSIWGTNATETGFVKTGDTHYIPGKTYYTSPSLDAVFEPNYVASISKITPASGVSVDTASFLSQINPVLTYSYTMSYNFMKFSDAAMDNEEASNEDGLDQWLCNDVAISSLGAYGITISNEDINTFSISIVVDIAEGGSGWHSNLYEYQVHITDLDALAPGDLRTISSIVSNESISFSPEGRLDFTVGTTGASLMMGAQEIDGVKTEATMVVFTPYSDQIMGILDDWQINAKSIYVQTSLTVAEILTAESIIMREELADEFDESGVKTKTGYSLTATQVWVDNYIVEQVWPKIKIVNNAAADAMAKAKQALTKAEAGIALGNSNLTKINDILKRAVLDFNPTPVNAGQYGAYLFKWSNSTGAVSTWGGTGLDIVFSSTTHYHTLSADSAVYDGSRYLKIKMSKGHSSGDTVDAGSINLAPALKGVIYDLEGDSEAGTLSWKIIGGSTGNFNIADTEYFKERAVSAVKMEALTAGVGTGAYAYAYDMNDEKISGKYATCALSLNSTDKKVNLYYSGSIIASYDLSSFHTTAYNAGWNDCRDAATDNSITNYSKTSLTLYTQNSDGSYSKVSTTYYYKNGTTTDGYNLPDAK